MKTQTQPARVIWMAAVIIMGIYSSPVEGQSLKFTSFLGFDVSFGTRSFNVNSNISKIDGMRAIQEGGSLGLVFGNNLLKTKVKLAGFYYSNANTPRTQELYELATTFNFYPLHLLKSSRKVNLNPYLTAGLSLDNVKFFGTYLDNQNSRQAYDPYLGKLSLLNGLGGIGIEYQFNRHIDFIHLFVEAAYGAPLVSRSSVNSFSETSIAKFTSFSVGVSFGKHRGSY